MGLFTNPLGHAGYPPGVTGTPSTQPSEVRAATATEVAAGVLNNCYVSPATASSLDAGLFASPPVLGSTAPNAVHATTLAANLTNHGVLFGSGTNGNIAASAALAQGQTIVGAGSGANAVPTYFSNAKVTYVPTFNAIPVMSASTGGVAAVTINTTNVWAVSQWGSYFECYNNTASTNIAPALSATAGQGLNIDNITGAVSKIIEITEGNSVNTKMAFQPRTSAAFYVQASFNVNTLADVTELNIGFRKVQAYSATGLSAAAYTDYAIIGVHSTAGHLQLQTNLASGGNTVTDTTNTITAGTTYTLEVLVDASGNVTYLINGIAPTVTAAYQFGAGLTVIPWIYYATPGGGHAEVDLVSYQCGFQ